MGPPPALAGGRRIRLAIAKLNRLAFDTNAVIYYLEQVEPYRSWLNPIFQSLDNGSRSSVISPLVEAEFLIHPLSQGNLAAIVRIDALMSHPFTTVPPIDRHVAQRAALIRSRLGIALIDAIIVATAIVSECDALVGNDRTCARRVTEIPYIYLDEVAGRSPV